MLRIEFRIKKSMDARTSLSPPGVELGGSKDWHVSNVILYWNGKVDSFWGWRLPKSPIISNNCSNKNCWELNFVQKVSGRTFLSPSGMKVGDRKIDLFQIFIVLKWETSFIFGMSAAKITDYIKKLFKIKFRTKKSSGAYVYLPQKWS